MEQDIRAGIQSMPLELLDEIFSLLSQPPPSIKRLHEEPFYDITHSTECDLKSTSYVSKRWRLAILPILYQHTRIILLIDNVQTNWPIEQQGFLGFVRENHLESKIHSFTMVVQDYPPVESHYYQDKSLRSLANHWTRIFNVINPLRLTIVAPPPLLGYLAALQVDLEHFSDFHMPYHILSLEQSSKLIHMNRNEGKISGIIPLLDLRPWHSLLLNEGSFVRWHINPPYHDFERGPTPQPPSILRDIVHNPPRSLCQTINSFSYIALYPPESYVGLFVVLFEDWQCGQRLYIQLAPRCTDATIRCLELRRKFFYIFLFLAIPSFEGVTEIRCGDAAVGSAWKDALKRTIPVLPSYWRVDPERNGVLVRNMEQTAQNV
jgi:hypothetical protein